MQNISKINDFMIQKRVAMIVDPADIKKEDCVNPNLVFGALANLETWAYTVEPDLVKQFMKVSEDTFIHQYYEPLVTELKKLKGDDVSHDRFVFPDFPDGCREIPEETLSELRFIRYYTSFIDEYFGTDFTSGLMAHTVLPGHENLEYVDRPEVEKRELTTIKSATIQDFYQLNKNLIGSKSALSELDREIVDFAIHNPDIPKDQILPKEIPYKETMALMLKYDIEENLHLNLEFSNYDDFKRSLCALSNQDPASKRPKLCKFTTKEKRYLLEKLEKAAEKNPDIVKAQIYKDRHFAYHLSEYWKFNRLTNMENGEKVPLSPKINAIFQDIQHGVKMKTMETEKGEAVKNKDSIALLHAVQKSPGELFRRLYFMLDNAKNQKETREILDTARKVSLQVPNDILLNAKAEIENSKNPTVIKTAFPHGDTRMAMQYENSRGPIKQKVIDEVSDICQNAVIARLSTKLDYSDKKIYISEDMKKCPVPFGVKGESNATRTLTKGTKYQIDGVEREEKVLGCEKEKDEFLRFFVYKRIKGGGYCDLSLSFLDKDCNLVDQCSWTHLKIDDQGKNLAVYSGDGYDSQRGLSEFTDVNLKVLDEYAKRTGTAYIAMQLHSWNRIPFKDMDQCFAGVMKCDDMIQGSIDEGQRYKIFDPKKVKQKIDITGNEISTIPLVYNVETRELVVADIAIPKEGFVKAKEILPSEKQDREEKLMKYANRYHVPMRSIVSHPTLESCNSIVANVTRNLIENHYPNLYDLYTMAAVAGGATIDSFVEREEDANISFSWKGTVTPYDRDVITADFMTVEKENMEKMKEPEFQDTLEKMSNGYYRDLCLVAQNLSEARQMEKDSISQEEVLF